MNNDKIIMGKKVLFTFCIFLVFGIAKSQTYRCVGQYLEAHPYQCDLFVVTDTNNEASAILMCRPSLSYYFCDLLNELNDTTSNLIVAELLINKDSCSIVNVFPGRVCRQFGDSMIVSTENSMLNKAWANIVNKYTFELIYGKSVDMPNSIKLAFYFDSGHKRDRVKWDGQLQLGRDEYERRKALLVNSLKNAQVTIPNLAWPSYDGY